MTQRQPPLPSPAPQSTDPAPQSPIPNSQFVIPNSLSLGWRQLLLAEFPEELATSSRLTIVGDPDDLLIEPAMMDTIRSRGFELIPFDDHVAFRYAYESRFRQRWDRGDTPSLVVVLRNPSSEFSGIPYDLLEEARASSRLLSFSLVKVFPDLAPNVVAELDKADFDRVFAACKAQHPGVLGENATRDFLLRHVFDVATEQIKAPHDLLRILLRQHYRGLIFPASVGDRLIEMLRSSGRWEDWPLEEIVPNRSAFLTFLQERWPYYLQEVIKGRSGRCAEPVASYGLTHPGPDYLPFDHGDVRVYIDNLFVEGYLTPICVDTGKVGTNLHPSKPVAPWWRVGVIRDRVADTAARLEKLIALIREELPDAEAAHTAWQTAAWRWADATALRCELSGDISQELRDSMDALHDQLEALFEAWMLARYPSLHNLPYLPRPMTVDKVPGYLAHRLRNGTNQQRRAALLVVDGLALDQWLVLKRGVEAIPGVQLEDGTIFAWAPTLTSVSRQAIFAGELPFYFKSSIGTTQKEESHWRRFWENEGQRGPAVGYLVQKKQEDETMFLERVLTLVDDGRCRVAGIVLGTVDQSMHGMAIGTGGMHAAVREWLRQGLFGKLIGHLLERGFEVFVTADHGNIEGHGIGKPNVGATADERGERVHVFDHPATRDKVHGNYPRTVIWPNVGLPEDYLALFAAGRGAFIPEGKRSVGHGGISLEEIIVPFARITN